jgi:hypothetical protein
MTITPEPFFGWDVFVLSGKVSKFSIIFIFCIFSDCAPFSVSRVLRDRRQSKTESELTFAVVVYLEFWVCCLCSMDEVLIHFSLVFDRWTTIPTPPLELTDGSVVTSCTAPIFPPCSGACCTILATQGPPHTMVIRIVSSGLGDAGSMWTSRLTP